jgi:hypothetical protein
MLPEAALVALLEAVGPILRYPTLNAKARLGWGNQQFLETIKKAPGCSRTLWPSWPIQS